MTDDYAQMNGTHSDLKHVHSAPAAHVGNGDYSPPTRYLEKAASVAVEKPSALDKSGTSGDKPRGIVRDLISQLKVGNDLSHVHFPTFVLEPRSLLEKLTDFLIHSQLLLCVPRLDDPVERMVGIVRWYISGWHVRPTGVKKPYNPAMGEIFRCKYHHAQYGVTTYLAEQVSHHPPVSAFNMENQAQKILFNGVIQPRSRFLGNSAASVMEGECSLQLLALGEHYSVTWPSVYARNLIVGTMFMEICGDIRIRCEQTGLHAELNFKAKGHFGNEPNRVLGTIRRIGTKELLYRIDGRWDTVVNITNVKTKDCQPLFEVEGCPETPKEVAPEDEQDPLESRRLWSKVTKALLVEDYELASIEKQKIENQERGAIKRGEARRIRFFRLNEAGVWEKTCDPYMSQSASALDYLAPNGLIPQQKSFGKSNVFLMPGGFSSGRPSTSMVPPSARDPARDTAGLLPSSARHARSEAIRDPRHFPPGTSLPPRKRQVSWDDVQYHHPTPRYGHGAATYTHSSPLYSSAPPQYMRGAPTQYGHGAPTIVRTMTPTSVDGATHHSDSELLAPRSRIYSLVKLLPKKRRYYKYYRSKKHAMKEVVLDVVLLEL